MTDQLREYRVALERYAIDCAKYGHGDKTAVDAAVRALIAAGSLRTLAAWLREENTTAQAIAAELLPKDGA